MGRAGPVGAALLLLALLPAVAAAEGGAAHGERLYAACAPCHQLSAQSGRSGPSLLGVLGRRAGSLEDFRFSRAMAGSGVTWTEEALDAFLENPQAYVKGTRMPFAGIRDPADRAAIISYLAGLRADRGDREVAGE
jgi:cytochrome c